MQSRFSPLTTRPRAGRRRPGRGDRPHVIYLAIGFPPAAKSSAYRMRETANQFAAQGWDVTVITLADESWEREYGVDHTLSAGVDPRIDVVGLPLARTDLETDIRAFSEARSLRPRQWIEQQRRQELKVFPEPVFGGWRPELEKAVLRVHRDRPADLLMTTCAPYVNLAATWRLWQEHRVPYVVDFRDGWSVDVIDGGAAFAEQSPAGRWEKQVLAEARAVWCVNEPIAEFYRERYPAVADRVRVVRNGYDEDCVPAGTHRADPASGLTFGYLGSINFAPALLDSVLTGWRMARREDPVLARSRFEVRGHIGAGALREANAHMELLRAASDDGVEFGGPLPKAEVAAAYGRWDALVLMLVGGRFVTSGKVYEYAASGLPVLSAHEVDHDAATVLAGHPLWTGAVGLDPRRLATSFVEAARLAVEASDDDRAATRAHARRYARDAQLAPAVAEVTAAVVGTATRQSSDGTPSEGGQA
ncbi:glycosyltransferase [Micromonospora peucetia]|uniref:Glycosyltransferase n=1 Tax=Micromonospora peucetia TaxID=47871 RepID=A0A1C6W731_9ACTN|nr:glycosyltransferase [Micromonospora peucetia]WSA33002.1 glycosyltransferase [Micromonospora peucetia]SCL74020.1 Glycosyltransferase involved in cell wall bisynthesis [Micromonospora peucetia]